ncbi:MAG: hypothetical protein M0R06_03910 [Sphaerochaeta sp.]|jgi:hypothetical protein|nr:hypothetical protein [Sphaerochaeta sp.]
MKDAIKEKVFTAIGESSMCWDPIPTGVFDSTAAQKIGERLAADLASAVEDEPKDCGFTLATCPYERCAGITMRKPVEVEPLAVLADRKGYFLSMVCCEKATNCWMIGVSKWNSSKPTEYIYGKPYAECEAKARAYLNGLPDKGAK